MKYECGNADICQEIDNSNKLVAKRSNSLPNGTILPLLPAANQTIRVHTDVYAHARVYRRITTRFGMKFTRLADIYYSDS